MESFNVVVTVSTTVCIDAENPDDAIEKVSQALNNGDANMSADVASNIGYSMRNGHYEVTNAIPMDEDYDEGSGNEEDDESEEWEQHNRREGDFIPSWNSCTALVNSFCARISDGMTLSPPLSERRRRCTNSTARSLMR